MFRLFVAVAVAALDVAGELAAAEGLFAVVQLLAVADHRAVDGGGTDVEQGEGLVDALVR
ncbi:hypothetical protein D3C78_1932100 [compost metagenome]